MIEYLDVYDEEGNFLRQEDRKIVHRDALWHNTIHCWLYDNQGNIYFQIRKEENKLYTTASGHVKAGETVRQGFGREVEEEIGIKVDTKDAVLVRVNKFVIDLEKKDGSLYRDRAFSNIYAYSINNDKNFKFDLDEINGLVKVKAQDVIDLFNNQKQQIPSVLISQENDEIKEQQSQTVFNDFLICKGETAFGKYGDILDKIIDLTNN